MPSSHGLSAVSLLLTVWDRTPRPSEWRASGWVIGVRYKWADQMPSPKAVTGQVVSATDLNLGGLDVKTICWERYNECLTTCRLGPFVALSITLAVFPSVSSPPTCCAVWISGRYNTPNLKPWMKFECKVWWISLYWTSHDTCRKQTSTSLTLVVHDKVVSALLKMCSQNHYIPADKMGYY